MLSNMPTPASIGTREEPPELIKGNVMPVMGIEPVTTAMFIAACRATIIVMPAARRDPKESGALSEALNPRHAKIAYRNTTRAAPKKPSSSPIMAKMKSVCCSGR